jgi:hypothetical protein
MRGVLDKGRVRNRKTVVFRCTTAHGIWQWRNGGPEETHYNERDWPWRFCEEAYRPVCERLRAEGKCCRSSEEWKELAAGDKG